MNNCTACETYQTERVSKYCPKHKFCDCDNPDYEEQDDGQWLCSECERPDDRDYQFEDQ
jgi:hypothetical protein